MPKITQMHILIRTASHQESNPNPNSRVYFGICGREFRLATAGTDFERGSPQIFKLGIIETVNAGNYNDPRQPYQLMTESLNKYPKYIRFEPADDNDNWCLDGIEVTVNPDTDRIRYSALYEQYTDEFGRDKLYIWLGARSSKIFYFGA